MMVKKVAKAKIAMSLLMKNKRGFTLLEVMVVLLIMALGVGMGVRKMFNPAKDVRANLRTICSLSKRLFQQAQFRNKTYRITFEMPTEENESHIYYVESSSKENIDSAKVKKDASKKLLSQKKQEDEEDKEDENTGDFQIDTDHMKEPQSLQDNYIFKEFRYRNREERVSEGKAFIHYLSQGITEETMFHISSRDEKLNWTVLIHPLTGNCNIIDGPPSETMWEQ